MAAVDRPLTDEELKDLSTWATQEDVDALTDEEAQRLERLVAPPEEDTATERKFTQAQPVGGVPAQPEIESGVSFQKFAAAPLAGKPTLAEFEASKAPPPAQPGFPDSVMQLPTYGTKLGADAPPLPSDLTLGNLGKRLGAAEQVGREGVVEEASNPPYAGEASMEDPLKLVERIRTQQNARIKQGQSLEAVAVGDVPYVSSKATEAVVRAIPTILPTVIEDQIRSLSEFAHHPMLQAARSPMEFGGNVAMVVGGISSLRKIGTGSALKELKALEDSLKAAPPEAVASYRLAAEGKLDQASMLQDQMRALGASEDDMERVREVKRRLEEIHDVAEGQVLAENQRRLEELRVNIKSIDDAAPVVETPTKKRPGRAKKAANRVASDKEILAENDRRVADLQKFIGDNEGAEALQEIDLQLAGLRREAAKGKPNARIERAIGQLAARRKGIVDAQALAAKVGAASKAKLTEALSATPLGMIALKGAAKDDVDEPGAARSGLSPFALKSALFAPVLMYGFGRLIKSPEFRQALLEFTQIKKTNPPDLEKVFETLLAPLFPDTPANGFGEWIVNPITKKLEWLTPPVAAGAAAGAFAGSDYGTDDVKPVMAALGAAGGGVFGGIVGSAFAHSFKTDLTYRQLYRLWFTEAANMSPEALNAKHMAMQSLDGRIAEIKDTAQLVSTFDSPTQALMHSWMTGDINLAAVPEEARWAAAKTRLLFDELTLDLLSSGLIEDGVLAEKLTSNLGTYLPRQFLRYELGEHNTNVVQAWLTSQGKGWGYLSSQEYLKKKNVGIDADVLKALGEIKDRPGYLLAKRGVLTATDVEMARYHRFLLSSPENSIPEDILVEGQKARDAYGKLVKEDVLANKANTLLRKQDVGEIPETNYAPQIAQENQQKAAARIGEKTIARSYEYLKTDTELPKFLKASNGMDAATWNGETFWKMPDNPRYGLVQNKYIHWAVANDLMGMHEASSGLSKIFGNSKMLSVFKFNKAVYNPASQIRNMGANGIFADVLAGVSPWRVDKWVSSGKELATGGKIYQQARRDGLFGGGFTPTEIESLLYPDLKASNGYFDYVARATEKVLGNTGLNPKFYMRWHQSSEAHARLTVYMHAVEELKMAGPEAAAFARKVIPDYRDAARWLKVYRSNMFGAPFISFSYKALPRMFESAVAFGNPKQMLRFWKYPLAMAAVNEYSANTMGHLGSEEGRDVASVAWRMFVRTASMGMGNPDSYDTYKKFLPGHVGAMQVLMPHRDEYDRPRYYDMTYLLPWGDISEGGRGAIGTALHADWFPRQLEPANPWMQVFTASQTGKDTFTGQDIIGAGQNPVAAGVQYLARTWGPSVVLNPKGYGAQNLYKSFNQGPVADPYVKSRTDAVVSEIFAGRTRPVDPQGVMAQLKPKLAVELRVKLANIKKLGRVNLRDSDEVLSSVDIEAIRKAHPGEKMIRALDDYQKTKLDFYNKYMAGGPTPQSPEKLVKAIEEFERRNKK